MTQYTTYYSNLPSSFISLIDNKIGLWDSCVAFRTGQYEYSAIIGSRNLDNGNITGTLYVYNSNTGSLSSYDRTNETINYSNEFTVYSNYGIGQYLNESRNSIYGTRFLSIITCSLIIVLFIGQGLKLWKKTKFKKF